MDITRSTPVVSGDQRGTGRAGAAERPSPGATTTPSAATPPRPLSVSAIVVGSAAPLALAAFWSEVFGVPVMPGSTGRSASLMTSPRVPLLAFELSDEPTRRGGISMRVWTDAFDEQVARLAAVGAPVSRPRSSFIDREVAEVVDPEGNRLVLVQE